MWSLSHGVPIIRDENYSRLSVPTIFKKINLQLVANHQISNIRKYVHSNSRIGKLKFKFKLPKLNVASAHYLFPRFSAVHRFEEP